MRRSRKRQLLSGFNTRTPDEIFKLAPWNPTHIRKYHDRWEKQKKLPVTVPQRPTYKPKNKRLATRKRIDALKKDQFGRFIQEEAAKYKAAGVSQPVVKKIVRRIAHRYLKPSWLVDCRKRKAYNRNMMRKLAAQVRKSGGAGALAKWRSRLLRKILC